MSACGKCAAPADDSAAWGIISCKTKDTTSDVGVVEAYPCTVSLLIVRFRPHGADMLDCDKSSVVNTLNDETCDRTGADSSVPALSNGSHCVAGEVMGCDFVWL